ncbi:hypothetical protein CCR75_000175 [Bremia lactucae]|uniref:Uncharacterized protein n=1 Tax=Bremia lactucae TaxID=4779 RepID=A0A976FNX9_BRELC|nr:hypothetical protein CCR75_000175 [Bremia lactucae]
MTWHTKYSIPEVGTTLPCHSFRPAEEAWKIKEASARMATEQLQHDHVLETSQEASWTASRFRISTEVYARS